MSYRGYDWRDIIAGRLASVFAIGAAFVPTEPCQAATPREISIGYLHLLFAASLFLTLAYFSLKLFTKTTPDRNPTPQKRQRNIVYRVAGYTILASIFLSAVVRLTSVQTLLGLYPPVFWLESIIVVAFGISWLVKGEAILKDQKPPV